MKDKFSAEDRETITQQVQRTIDWISQYPNAEKHEYEQKLKEIEDVFNPIMTRIY